MSFNVRCFAHEGLSQMRLIHPHQYSADSVFQLTQPYKWSQVLSVSASPISSAPDSTTGVHILRIEVPDGQSVRYEINPPGRNVAAGNASPILSGLEQFQFEPGWSLSVVDAASYP